MTIEHEQVKVHFTETKIITKPEFELYLKSRGWLFDCKVWRSKDFHDVLCLQSLQRSLNLLAEHEKRSTGEVWLDIMCNPLERNK